MEKNKNFVAGLFILACFYTLYFARAVFLPIVVAILLNFLLAPLVRYAKKFHIPESISALLVIVVFLGAIGYGFYSLSGPASEWLDKAPQNFSQVAKKIEVVKKPIEESMKNLFSIRHQLEESAKITNGEVSPITIRPAFMTNFNVIFTSTGEFFVQLSMIFFILYFLLASGDFFLIKTVEIQPTLKKKKEAVFIAREIKNEITNFLLIKTLTGLGLAAVIGVVMYFLGMPNPLLWGILAGVLEFIPYIGVMVGTFLCAIAALFAFDNMSQILLAPISFFTIASLAGNFIVPLILSKSLTLHPVIIFVGVIFGGWMWGVIGALIAVPLLSILKIFCNNIPALTPMSKFLGE
jgi:predicted PurR-regulated permease PerM